MKCPYSIIVASKISQKTLGATMALYFLHINAIECAFAVQISADKLLGSISLNRVVQQTRPHASSLSKDVSNALQTMLRQLSMREENKSQA
jgi:hypothetical protein